MITVYFYQFAKPNNSTRQPTGESLQLSCEIKGDCSLTAPVLAVKHAKPIAFNYCYIPDFGRFYFISEWQWRAGIWVASCGVDVLASWKNEIGASPVYVTRSATSYNGDIVDGLYPATNNVTVSEVSDQGSGELGDVFKSSISEGCYVVGIINQDSGAVGCVSYYVFNNSQFRAFCAALMGDSAWFYEGIEEIGDELAKSIFNPFQYVVSCMWFPFSSLPTSGGGVVTYGWYQLPGVYGAGLASDSVRLASATFQIPKHPQSGRGHYLNRAPFSKYTLAWPCFGQFALDSNIVGSAEYISAQCFVDPISGGGTLNIFADNKIIFTTQTSVGVPIQIAQMTSNIAGATNGVLQTVGSALSGNLLGAVAGITSAITEGATAQVTTMGKNGMISSYKFPPVLHCEFFQIVEEDLSHRGRPLCSVRTPESLGGYLIAEDVEISLPCTDGERNEIVSFMQGGFFYE